MPAAAPKVRGAVETISWSEATESRREPLRGSSVHVWRVDIATTAPALDAHAGLLTADELFAVQRFAFAADRRRARATRIAARLLASWYLGAPADRVAFGREPRGRPFLPGLADLDFSLSHSGDLLLFAFSRQARVGIDLEAEREMDDALAIAHSFFAPDEVHALESEPSSAVATAFLRHWTRKEALLKALGTGLSMPLNEITIPVGDGACTVSTAEGSWSLLTFVPLSGYHATVASRQKDPQWAFFTFDPSRVISGRC